MRSPLRTSVLSAFLLIVLAAACGPERRQPEPDNLFWPLPPDPPRIRYLQSVYSEDDIGREYSFVEKLFGKDYFDRLMRPYGVSARGNKIIVADIMLKRVLIFDRTTKRLRVVGEEGAVQLPAGAVFGRDETLYVADSSGGKVALYAPSGKYKTAFLMKEGKPVGLALDEKRSRLYVTDIANHRVVVFGLDGERLFTFGSKGNGPGQFNLPLGIALDDAGTAYVLDAWNYRVQLFDPDGAFLARFGSVGDGPGFLANPKGIALDSEGHIYITDAAFNNVQIFDREGRVLLAVGSLGPQPGQMHLPAGIAVDEQDRIYVADQMNGRVQVFQYLKGAQEQ